MKADFYFLHIHNKRMAHVIMSVFDRCYDCLSFKQSTLFEIEWRRFILENIFDFYSTDVKIGTGVEVCNL